MDVGLIRLPAMGATLREIDFSADLRDQRIRITRASITSGSGAAEIQGSLVLRGFGLQEMDLTASLDRFLAWNTAPFSPVLTGDLRLQGPIEEPRLAGTLDLEGSKIELDDVSSGSEMQAVELTEERMIILGQLAEGVDPETIEVGQEMELALGTLYEDEENEYLIWKWKPVAA